MSDSPRRWPRVIARSIWHGLVYLARWIWQGLVYYGLAYAGPYALWLLLQEQNSDSHPKRHLPPGHPERQGQGLPWAPGAWRAWAGLGAGPLGWREGEPVR